MKKKKYPKKRKHIKQKRKNIKCLPFLPSVHRLTLYYCPFLLLCRDSRSAYEMVLRTFLLIALNMKICALIPYFILDWRKARCDFTFRLRWPSTFSPRFFSLLLIVAGGTLCLAMRDLWLWLWNSLNTLIFTRAHLTMRYIALFLFLLLVCTRAHWNCNQTLIWSNSSSEKNHQNSGAMIVRCVSHRPPKEIKNKMGKNNEPTSVRILSDQSAECWQELTVALLKVNCIVCWFSSRESTRYAHVRQFALCLHNSQLRLFIMHESSDQNNPQ